MPFLDFEKSARFQKLIKSGALATKLLTGRFQILQKSLLSQQEHNAGDGFQRHYAFFGLWKLENFSQVSQKRVFHTKAINIFIPYQLVQLFGTYCHHFFMKLFFTSLLYYFRLWEYYTFQLNSQNQHVCTKQLTDLSQILLASFFQIVTT